MEGTVRWYKKHLAGFVDSFEDDMRDNLYDELEAFAEWILCEFEGETGASLLHSEKSYLRDYLRHRAGAMRINDDMDGEVWFENDHKLLRNIIK